VRLQPSLRLAPFDAVAAPDDPAASAPTTARRRYLLPALASAVLPGAGEIATGHIWNGLPLLAAEVAIWMGYVHYNDEGKQLRSQYEVFADAHWSYARWQDSLRVHYNTDDPPPQWYNEEYPYHCDCSPPYIPKDVDPQEYYENAGKYRHFWPGWEDWVYNPADPVNSDSQALRAEYISMRNRSNDNFDSAGTMLGMAVLTRAVSVAQTLWLVRRDTRNAHLQLQPTYSSRKGAGMKVTWSY
jgi:hypothetical protein